MTIKQSLYGLPPRVVHAPEAHLRLAVFAPLFGGVTGGGLGRELPAVLVWPGAVVPSVPAAGVPPTEPGFMVATVGPGFGGAGGVWMVAPPTTGAGFAAPPILFCGFLAPPSVLCADAASEIARPSVPTRSAVAIVLMIIVVKPQCCPQGARILQPLYSVSGAAYSRLLDANSEGAKLEFFNDLAISNISSGTFLDLTCR
jgi:hypothetical protein